MLVAVLHDVLGQGVADARHIAEQAVGGRVEVHPHAVHAGFHHIVQALLEGRLVHIVLVLAHADALGLHFHQLGQGILEAAGDADGAAHRQILVGELLPGHIGRAVHRGAGFAHGNADHLRAARILEPLAQEGFGFAATGAVAHGDGFDGIAGGQLLQERTAAFQIPLGLQRVDGGGLHELAQAVDDRQLAAGADARVHPQGAALPRRRRQQQVLQVHLEHLDGLGVGLLLGLHAHIGLQRGRQEAVEGVLAHGVQMDPVAAGRVHGNLGDEHRHQLLPLHQQLHGEDVLLLAPAHGQHPMGRHLPQGLLEVPIGLEAQGGLIPLLLLPQGGLQDAVLQECLAHPRAVVGVLRQALRQDVPGPLHALGGRLQAFLVLLHEGCGQHQGIRAGSIGQQGLQQRLQAPLPGLRGLGALLGLVGEVEILQLRLGPGALDAGLELLGELALLLDGLEHRLPALQQFLEVGHPVLDGPDRDLVQGARGLLPVPGDEGHRVPFLQQGHHRGHPRPREAQFQANAINHLLHGSFLSPDAG
ncbi:MAG: hypothetical protein BWY56_00833 [Acidobacteria bacterium ADurb.Bin340]|nr:MAG: hypothetical protein BWY56_00833 [Acidobacteria bacterium ADurb.Bin340]